MKRPALCLLPILVLSFACTTTNPSSSQETSAPQGYVFDSQLKDAINQIKQAYKTKEFGDFGSYRMELTGAAGGAGSVETMLSDPANNYFKDYVVNSPMANGSVYYYQQDGHCYRVGDIVNRDSSIIKQYYYLTNSEWAQILAQAKSLPYQMFDSYVSIKMTLTDGEWKDVEMLKASSSGGYDIHFRGQVHVTGDTWASAEYELKTTGKKLTHFRYAQGSQSVFEWKYDEESFQKDYPKLSGFTAMNEPPVESGDEDPLGPEDYLVDYDNNRTYYQLLVYSFADSNGDGIGDFKGIADKLDYLVDLGIEGIWLSPILSASSYHSYDITDYYEINPHYNVEINGTKYGINYLLKECHKRNIKVLMDLVLNHTSYNHIWRYEHSDWYGSDNRFGFPEFNFDKAEVRQAIKDVGTYWLNRGFDGFRLDAAMWIYNSGSNRHQKNYAFWSDWCEAMKQAKPDCYLIGEVLDDTNHDLAYQYANAGFDSTFDFNALSNVIHNVKGNKDNYADATSADIQKATSINPDYILGRPLSNHDIGRFNQEHPDSSDKAYYVDQNSDGVAKVKLANAINALTPGNAFIYYGDELGLVGTCEDTRPDWYYDMNYRTPMPWNNGRTNSVSYFESFHGSGVTTSRTYSGKTAEQDRNDNGSIYAALKGALALKNSSETLQKGTISSLETKDSGIRGFNLAYENEIIQVLYNISGNDYVTTFGSAPLYALTADSNGSQVTIHNNGLAVTRIGG